MPLDIQIKPRAGYETTGAVTVKLGGSLDTATSPELERQLAPVLAGKTKDIVFDLNDLKFISSAGLRVFAMTRKKLVERSGHASFVNMQPQIREVFEIIRATPGVYVFRNDEELDAFLAKRQLSHEEKK